MFWKEKYATAYQCWVSVLLMLRLKITFFYWTLTGLPIETYLGYTIKVVFIIDEEQLRQRLCGYLVAPMGNLKNAFQRTYEEYIMKSYTWCEVK